MGIGTKGIEGIIVQVAGKTWKVGKIVIHPQFRFENNTIGHTDVALIKMN